MARFQKGQHWRSPQPWWDRDWLAEQYAGHPAAEIAGAYGVTENAILYWLSKHGIARRSMSEVRLVKKWGSFGAKNPMFGRCGDRNPNWRGGLTPYRQSVYASSEWTRFVAAIEARDKSCVMCGAGGRLVVHHIRPVAEMPLLIMAEQNVVRLCVECHKRAHRRVKWWGKKFMAYLEKATSTAAAC